MKYGRKCEECGKELWTPDEKRDGTKVIVIDKMESSIGSIPIHREIHKDCGGKLNVIERE